MQEFEVSKNIQKKAPENDLMSQVASDLAFYIDQFSNKTLALRNLSKETKLNEKTLRRLLKKENKPSSHTLHKIYFAMTKSSNEEEMLASCPAIIRKCLCELNIDKLKREIPKQYDFLNLIESYPILGEVYALLGTKNLDISEVVYRFGQYGADILSKLSTLGIAQEIDKGLYKLSDKQPHLDGSSLKLLGLRLTRRYAKSDVTDLVGQSFISLYCEGLNEQGKIKWLEIDQMALKEKAKIAQSEEYKGSEPMFTFQVTDSLNESVNEGRL